METNTYILYIEQSSQGDEDFYITVLNITGGSLPLYGSSGDFGCVSLRLIYKARNKPEEIKRQIEALPIVNNITLIPISSPIEQSELVGLRNIFLKIGWDTQDVSGEELSTFFQSILKGQNTHYIAFDHIRHRTSPVKISIKKLQDHPNFKPEWIRETNIDFENLPDKEFTKDDFTTVEIKSTSYE